LIRVLSLALAVVLLVANTVTASAANTRFFPETQQTVRDAFLDFFDANGGLDIFGFPRTGEFVMNGHYVQYFQRARFEYWPENPPGQQIQLGLLAVELGRSRPPSTQSADPNRRWFPESQHSIGGGFREFWETRGGVAVFGYPITDETDENGRAVQYFQRARFEWHGENPVPYRVQLGLLGDEQIALGKVTVPTDAAPKVAPAGVVPIAPSAAGPGKLLVSTGQYADFYIMDPTGENAVRIGKGADPTISRDGTKIAYATNDQPNPGLYVANPDGSGRTLVYAGLHVRGPVFSPDVSKIAFWERFECLRIVFRRNLEDMCNRVKVIPIGGGTDWLVPGQSAYANSPSWSGDGSRLLFKDEKYIAVASPSKPDEGARPLTPFDPRHQTPAWSPLGGKIATAMDMNRDHYEIVLLPDDGRDGVQPLTQSPPFTDPPQTSLSPAWSPDGQRIAFVSDRDGVLRVWTMNADGSRPVKISDLPITSNNSFERLVSWGGTPGQPIPLPPPADPAPTPPPFTSPNLRPGG
jgi:hypothetical protein